MSTEEQIKNYIESESESKSADLQSLHTLMLKVLPDGKFMVFRWEKTAKIKLLLILILDMVYIL